MTKIFQKHSKYHFVIFIVCLLLKNICFRCCHETAPQTQASYLKTSKLIEKYITGARRMLTVSISYMKMVLNYFNMINIYYLFMVSIFMRVTFVWVLCRVIFMTTMTIIKIIKYFLLFFMIKLNKFIILYILCIYNNVRQRFEF